MGTKEILQQRPDIPDDQVEELVERAAKLQDDAASAREGRASTSDIMAVAAELDVAPEFVEQAIASWRREQQDCESTAKHARILERRKRTLRIVTGVGLLGVMIATLTTMAAFSVFGWQGLAITAVAGAVLLWFLLTMIT